AVLGLAPGHGRRERQAVRDRLRQADDVRNHPRVLEAPHPAGPRKAALDLVRDVEDAVLIAQRAQLLQERRWGRVVAALALDRLDEDAGHLGRRDLLREDPPQAGEGTL